MTNSPPNNLPVVPDDYEPLGILKSSQIQLPNTLSQTQIPSKQHGLGFRWGNFSLTEDDVAEFKNILEEDFDEPLPWNNDEIELMTYNLIYAFGILARVVISNQEDSIS